MKFININQLILGLVLLVLSACSSREILPEYQRGDKLQSGEAIGIFRVINAKDDGGFWDMLRESPVFVDIQKIKSNKWIQLKSNGVLDNADSSKIYAMRIPSGLYSIKYASQNIGNTMYSWSFDNCYFFVLPREVIYIGDIVLSRDSNYIWFFNNFVAVHRQLKKQYPELANKLVNREVHSIDQMRQSIKKYKEEIRWLKTEVERYIEKKRSNNSV